MHSASFTISSNIGVVRPERNTLSAIFGRPANLKLTGVNPWRNYSMFEMLLYNMRHVQPHSAQLNKLLRQKTNNAPAWVAQTKDDL